MITVRSGTPQDVPRVLEIERSCDGVNLLSEEELKTLAANSGTALFVAEEAGEVVGFVLGAARISNEDRLARIISMGVRHGHDFLLVGSKLLLQIEGHFTGLSIYKINAEVPRYNRIIDLFRLNHYHLARKLKNYFGPRRDAVKLVKTMQSKLGREKGENGKPLLSVRELLLMKNKEEKNKVLENLNRKGGE
jgi:hypothetical protein